LVLKKTLTQPWLTREEKLNEIQKRVEVEGTGERERERKRKEKEKEGVRWTRRRQRCLCTD